MSAEQLIALEAAIADLSTLYTVAKSYTVLQARAEFELLPAISALGSRLRGLVRSAHLTEEAINAAATEILGRASAWRGHLEDVRAAAIYQQALAALARDDQAVLLELIPQIFAGLQHLHPAPTLYFPISPSSGRRRPGGSPFLSPADCAERIMQTLAAGIAPEGSGAEWWDYDFPFISCVDSVAALDTPIALQSIAADKRFAVFAAKDDPGLRIFTPRLRTAMSVVVADEATDEWWEAYEDSYRSFRDALVQELAGRDCIATIVA